MNAATDARRACCGAARLMCGILVAGALALNCFAAPHSARSLVNKHAPEITRADLTGKHIDLKSLRGKVVLLNFWATWCAPCLVEMPVFSGWQQQYVASAFQVIGISMDDDVAPVRTLVAKLKPNYPIAMGDARLGEQYGGVMGLPLSYLIDRNGIVRARFQGETDPKAIEKELKIMLDRR